VLLNHDQEAIRDAVRAFAQTELWPHAPQWDRDHVFPRDAHRGLAALGAYGICVPEEHGGVGLDYLTLALVLEEIAAGDGGTSTAISVTNCPVNAILMRYGNAQQKRQWLEPLAQGRMLGAFCLTEPQAGSDASSLRTTATKEGDGYVIHGAKQFITSGQNGQVAIVIAMTDKAAGKKGMSAFLVPTDAPGYTVVRLEDKLGQHSSDTALIQFDACRVPFENRIGAEGEGYRIALGALEGGRIGIAAQAVGIARAAFEAALGYARERIQFGKPIIEHQGIANMLADMHTRLNAARLLVMHAAKLKSAGSACLSEASQAKLFASEMAESVCSAAVQIHGGYGFLQDYPVERYYRDARITQIYEGTSEIQRLVIARELVHYGL